MIQLVRGFLKQWPGSIFNVVDVSSTSTAVVTSIVSSTLNSVLIGPNQNRKELLLYNNSTKDCKIKFGGVASLTDFSLVMGSKSILIIDSPVYLGEINGIWVAVNGTMQVTEFS